MKHHQIFTHLIRTGFNGFRTRMSFKICVIGCGGIAFNQHGPAYDKYAREHPGTQLAACCDLAEQKALDFSVRFGFQRFYTDMTHMLEVERPDAVCMLVPPASTCELACQVLAMRFPLLLEKPPGLTITETDRIVAAARAGGTPNMVAFNRRMMPLVTILKSRLTGNLSSSNLQHLQYELYRVGRTDSDFSTTAIHGIDTARFIASSDYARIAFYYYQVPHTSAGVVNIFMDCTFLSGATAQLSFLPLSGAVIERAVLHFQDQAFFLHLPAGKGLDGSGSLLSVVNGNITDQITGVQAAGDDEDFVLGGFYAENTAFFDAIRNGYLPTNNIESGRQSVEIAQCIRERITEYRFPYE
jgi:myo-inositol 2-dehydrogenase/D-chiro-inositol 1-dehydrogenase